MKAERLWSSPDSVWTGSLAAEAKDVSLTQAGSDPVAPVSWPRGPLCGGSIPHPGLTGGTTLAVPGGTSNIRQIEHQGSRQSLSIKSP